MTNPIQALIQGAFGHLRILIFTLHSASFITFYDLIYAPVSYLNTRETPISKMGAKSASNINETQSNAT